MAATSVSRTPRNADDALASARRVLASDGQRRPTGSSSASSRHLTVAGAAPGTSLSSYSSSSSSSALRRHSIYGTEDRIVLDLGSRVWKAGFSGEPRPRLVFAAPVVAPAPLPSGVADITSTTGGGGAGRGPGPASGGGSESSSVPWGRGTGELWDLDLERAHDEAGRDEVEAVLQARVQACLRYIFIENLMLGDLKARRVVVLENALQPVKIRETITRVLFSNLQVKSVSFLPAHLLSVMATGRMTGLVVDCGHLETSVVPIFSGRPLTSLVRTTPRAGRRLTERLRALLLHFGVFVLPPATFGSAHVPAASRSTPIPREVLTDEFLEQIKARALFVSDPIGPHAYDEAEDEELMRRLHDMYASRSTATDLAIRVPAQTMSSSVGTHVAVPAGPAGALGRGTIVIPGWVRERAAECLFEGGDLDEESVVEVVLGALMKLHIDLRKPLVSSILLVGGTAMLPGFIPRVRAELLLHLSASSSSTPLTHRALSPNGSAIEMSSPGGARSDTDVSMAVTAPASTPPPESGSALWRSARAAYPWAPLAHLGPHLTILNDPSPPDTSPADAGSAPAFAPNMFGWVGASVAGSLKVSGEEVQRDKWEEAEAELAAWREAQAAARAAQRPSFGAAAGSFLGAASGLQLGTYGGLAATQKTFR